MDKLFHLTLFSGHVITYPCWYQSWSMLIKGATELPDSVVLLPHTTHVWQCHIASIRNIQFLWLCHKLLMKMLLVEIINETSWYRLILKRYDILAVGEYLTWSVINIKVHNTCQDLWTLFWYILSYCWGALQANFTNILQDYFSDTVVSYDCPKCPWSNPEGHRWIEHSIRNLFYNLDKTRHSIAMCIVWRYNDKTVLLRDTVHQISRGRSGGPYHITTQFYFDPVMSKIQNSINIYPRIWRRLTCPTQDFGNP